MYLKKLLDERCRSIAHVFQLAGTFCYSVGKLQHGNLLEPGD